MEVHIEGVEKVNARLAALGPEVLRAADRGLKAAGMNIIADAKENLRANHTNATGRLSQSGRVQKAADGGSGYDVGFMSDKAYAGAVEYGRRAGKLKYYKKLKQTRHQPPPPDELGQWAYKKHGLPRSAGWALAWYIGAHGTKPHPFFKPAVDKNQPRIAAAVRDAVQQVTNRTNV
jgi:HK97 gp10 family phage protein